MSIRVEVGAEIPVAGAIQGTSSKGPYYKVTVKDEKNRNRIDVWATNPSEAQNIVGMAQVKAIKKAEKKAHQYNGKWYDDFVVEAHLVQGNPEAPVFADLGETSDDDLPFA